MRVTLVDVDGEHRTCCTGSRLGSQETRIPRDPQACRDDRPLLPEGARRADPMHRPACSAGSGLRHFAVVRAPLPHVHRDGPASKNNNPGFFCDRRIDALSSTRRAFRRPIRGRGQTLAEVEREVSTSRRGCPSSLHSGHTSSPSASRNSSTARYRDSCSTSSGCDRGSASRRLAPGDKEECLDG